ncbi:MAG: arylsulfatase, partial [Ilumatobacteraceae bacterium]
WQEAEREGVLPLDDRGVELFGARFADRTVHPASRTYVYRPPMSPLPAQAAAAIGGRSWNLVAHLTRTAGQDGVLYATGTENSGLSIFLLGDRLIFDYNCFGEHHVVESSVPVPVGAASVGVNFRREGRAGRATLVVNGSECGELTVPFAMRTMSSVGPSVGYDHGSPVSDLYRERRDGFPFAGVLDRVEITLVAPSPQVEGEIRATEERTAYGRQ